MILLMVLNSFKVSLRLFLLLLQYQLEAFQFFQWFRVEFLKDQRKFMLKRTPYSHYIFVFTNRSTRVRPRFFDQVGHETMYASSGNTRISIFSLNLVIVRLTKIMKRADKNWAQFQKIYQQHPKNGLKLNSRPVYCSRLYGI